MSKQPDNHFDLRSKRLKPPFENYSMDQQRLQQFALDDEVCEVNGEKLELSVESTSSELCKSVVSSVKEAFSHDFMALQNAEILHQQDINKLNLQFQRQISSLTQQIADLKEANALIHSESLNCSQQLTTTLSSQEEEIIALKRQLKSLKNKNIILSMQNDEYKAQCAEADESNLQLTQQLSALRGQLLDLQGAHQQVGEELKLSQDQAASAKASVITLENQLFRQEQAADELRDENKVLAKQLALYEPQPDFFREEGNSAETRVCREKELIQKEQMGQLPSQQEYEEMKKRKILLNRAIYEMLGKVQQLQLQVLELVENSKAHQ